jgi:hypothetical protein
LDFKWDRATTMNHVEVYAHAIIIVVCAPHQRSAGTRTLCGGGGCGNNFMDALEPRLICNLLLRRNFTVEREREREREREVSERVY